LVFQQLELAQKQVELLTQAFPDRTRLAMLFDALSGQLVLRPGFETAGWTYSGGQL
jgi:hypothetical protein